MKRLWIGLLLLVLLISAMSVSAQDDEDGLALPILDDGAEIQDTFESPVFARLYAFAGTEGDVVTIGMYADGSDTDPYLVLMGASGDVLMTNDDFEGGSPDAVIEDFELPDTDTYFVLATMWESRLDQSLLEEERNTDFDYILTLDGVNTPDDIENPIELMRGELQIGSGGILEITEDEVVFYVSFTGNEGEIVSIEAQSVDIDTLLYLFDTEGNRLAVNDDREPGNLNAAIIDFELPEDGIYLVFIMPFNFYDGYLEDIIDTGDVDIRID